MINVFKNKHYQYLEKYVGVKKSIQAIACCFGLLFVTSSFAAVENLDEVVARKARLAVASWGYSLLQNDANYYTWQPETLIYSDVTTSNEVMRFSYTPTGVGGQTHDLAMSHWSANGNRVFFQSTRATNAFPYATGASDKIIWMLSNADGSRLKPAKGAAAQFATVDPYPAWSTIIPDIMYQDAANEGRVPFNNLYKTTVSDTVLSFSTYLTIPLLTTGTTMKLSKALSSDGRKLSIAYGGKRYPATVYPEASKKIDVPSGYLEALNLDGFWGGFTMPVPPATIWHEYKVAGAVNGADGIWALVMPEVGTGPYWRARLTGTSSEGGPLHTIDRTPPYDWGGEIEPVQTSTDGKNQPTPWCEDGTVWDGVNPCSVPSSNLDHAVIDVWGRFLSSGGSPSLKHWDTRMHNYYSFTSYLQKLSHHDWSAWSDWTTDSGYPSGDPYPPTFIAPDSGPLNPQSVWSTNYKTGAYNNIAYTHPRYNVTANPPYTANARPTQSPDGTKTMFNSTFLVASDSNIQLFWAVAYYPYPPQIQSATKNNNNIRLTWDFNQGTGCLADGGLPSPRTGSGVKPNFTNPRTYATRGWPHETLDCPPSPREIDKFRVWVSSDNLSWTPLGTTNYNNCRAGSGNECGMWAETSWTYDYAQPVSSTRYYAVTSLEYSGLESHTLSNTWKVVTDGSGNVATQVQQTAYPVDPGGKSDFYNTPPKAPIYASYTYKEPPASANGQYTIHWNAPSPKTMIRYYNIYAKDGAVPFTTDLPISDRQKYRIASIPASSDYTGSGVFKYIDWLGATDGSTQYIVSSVDYQGNETIYVAGHIPLDSVKRIPQ